MILFLAFAAAGAAPSPHSGPPAPARTRACPDLVTPEALVCHALEAQGRNDNASAAQGFEEAAKAASGSDSKTARMWAAAGNLWIAANQPAKAALDLDKALATASLDTQQRGQALLDRARAAEAQDDLKTARTKLTEAGQTISADPFYWYFSASLALREGDGATAKAAIGKALALAPSDPAILFEAGHVADFTGDDETARRYWARSAQSDPNGRVGRAAAKAVEMLGVTPTVKAEPPAKAGQPRS